MRGKINEGDLLIFIYIQDSSKANAIIYVVNIHPFFLIHLDLNHE